MTTTTPVCPEHGAAEIFQDEFGTFWCEACGRGFSDDGTTTTPPAPAGDVFDYYTQVFGVEPTHDRGTEYLHDYRLASHCGRESKKIIDKGKELLDICDSHPDVVTNIRRGVLAAVEVICFG